LRQRVQVALDAWAREWLSARAAAQSPADLELVAVDSARDASLEYAAMTTKDGSAWFRRSAGDLAKLGCEVVGAESLPHGVAADEWLSDVIERAWHARNRAVCAALFGASNGNVSAAEPPASVFAFGSGAIQISCAVWGLHAIADSSVWRTVPPTPRGARRLPKVTPVDRASLTATVKLEAILGSVAVELPKLLDLQCGDVLRLPERVDQGIAVLCDSKPFARAALGESRGNKCVQLISDYK